MVISIITPNFNGSKFLDGCIQSVLEQGVEFEHIIIDGGSTDCSLEIIKKYSHIKYISEKDNGMYDAINKGLKVASGDVIAYLNSDDRYPSGALSKVLKVFEKSNPDYVYGDCRLVDENRNELYLYKAVSVPRSILTKISVVPWAQPSSFYKRSVFTKLSGFDTKYKLAADYHFMKQVILYGFTSAVIAEPLSEFMKRNDALSSIFATRMAQEVEEINAELKIKKSFILNLLFNLYRKFVNRHTLFLTKK
jgi:glycosyltransferase involved in cell wall biosynthesis